MLFDFTFYQLFIWGQTFYSSIIELATLFSEAQMVENHFTSKPFYLSGTELAFPTHNFQIRCQKWNIPCYTLVLCLWENHAITQKYSLLCKMKGPIPSSVAPWELNQRAHPSRTTFRMPGTSGRLAALDTSQHPQIAHWSADTQSSHRAINTPWPRALGSAFSKVPGVILVWGENPSRATITALEPKLSSSCKTIVTMF